MLIPSEVPCYTNHSPSPLPRPRSLGYAGCVVARLTFGMHHYPALDGVAHPDRRAAAQRLALRLAAALLRPQQRAAQGWQQQPRGGEAAAVGLGAQGVGELGVGVGVSAGVRRLVADAEAWAVEELRGQGL